MKILFVKTGLSWPRSSGGDVHSYEMMRALIGLGVEVHFLTVAPPSAEAIAGLQLASVKAMERSPAVVDVGVEELSLQSLERRFCSYWGISGAHIQMVEARAKEIDADAVVAVGLEALPFLAGVRGRRRIWYAADEWVLHHWSQFSPLRLQSYSHLKDAAIKGTYERAFGSRVDRVWVVSRADARAIRVVMGVSCVDVIPNGVDAAFFAPKSVDKIPDSCVFWGRLDFGPNIDALRWFIRRVWPIVLRKRPSPQFTVFGFQPSSEVTSLAEVEGIELVPNQPDIRTDIMRHQLVVLPFVSGAGIKNKMLEAASMGLPIVASKKAMNGVHLNGHSPVLVRGSSNSWADGLIRLWDSGDRRRALGDEARDWVCASHTWESCARLALDGMALNSVAPSEGATV